MKFINPIVSDISHWFIGSYLDIRIWLLEFKLRYDQQT